MFKFATAFDDVEVQRKTEGRFFKKETSSVTRKFFIKICEVGYDCTIKEVEKFAVQDGETFEDALERKGYSNLQLV